MEFEVLKRSHLKRNIIIGVVVVAIISAILLNFTQAKYRVTQSIPIVNGTINYKVPDLNLVSLYVTNEEGQYVEADTIPTSGYTLNTIESYCGISNNGEIVKDDNVILNYENGSMTFSNVTRKGTKCYLYFDVYEEPVLLSQAILADNPTIDNSRSGEITGPLTDNTTGTLFTAEDDYGTSLIFAGDVDNNWVYFAEFYWRIIRINGDGSIRLIYSGDSESGPAETGDDTQIGTSQFNEQHGDNAYVGYMYGTPGSDTYEETHANINDSTIKITVDLWYKNNILGTKQEQYISTEAGFCGDRRIATTSEVFWEYDTKLGYGSANPTAYAPRARFLETNGSASNVQTPTLKCSQSNDLYTVNTSKRGNHALDYPIGLITTDEIVLAGGFVAHTNANFYLYTGQTYWTISSAYYHLGWNYMFSNSNNVNIDGGENLAGVRPVINLDANVTISSGDGTSSNPYVVGN